MPDLRSAVLAAAQAFPPLVYRLDPPPDGTTSVDCSLFVLKVLEAAGVPLAGVRTAEQIRQATVPVAWADVKPGTLLFFERTYDAAGPAGPDGKIASHIGISLGAGTRKMWDAHQRIASPAAAGITDISPAYWQDRLIEARDIPALTVTPAPSAILRGIDVSSNNGAVNWSQVAGSDVAFAFSKATGGTWYRNPGFARDWLDMKAAGIARGAYHFAFETSGQPFPGDGPEAEANYFAAELNRAGGLAAGDLLALDIEDGQGQLGDWCLRWLKRVETLTGVRALVYTGAWFAGPHGLGKVPALGSYPLWLADYDGEWPAATPPWTTVTVWQSSSSGRVPGVSGDVDTDVFHGTAEQLRALGKGGVAVPPAYSVGAGILAAMAANDDDPATDELFFKHGDRDAWSEAYGTSGARYVWLPSVGRAYRYDPAA